MDFWILILTGLGIIVPIVIGIWQIHLARKQLNQTSTEPSRSLSVLEHDKGIFMRADSLITGGQLQSFLGLLGSDHAFTDNSYSNISNLIHFLEDIDNSYINGKLYSKSLMLTKVLTDLEKFLTMNFSLYPPSNRERRMCMHPELNIDRGGEVKYEDTRYDKYARELSLRIQAVEKIYREYRMTVKKELNL